jgi:hypothetical protein
MESCILHAGNALGASPLPRRRAPFGAPEQVRLGTLVIGLLGLQSPRIHPASEQFILILAKNVASIERDIRPWNATTCPVWPLGSDDNRRPRAASMDGHDQTDQIADSPSRRRSGLVRKHHLIYCLREDSPLSGPIGLHQTPKALKFVPFESQLGTWRSSPL